MFESRQRKWLKSMPSRTRLPLALEGFIGERDLARSTRCQLTQHLLLKEMGETYQLYDLALLAGLPRSLSPVVEYALHLLYLVVPPAA